MSRAAISKEKNEFVAMGLYRNGNPTFPNLPKYGMIDVGPGFHFGHGYTIYQAIWGITLLQPILPKSNLYRKTYQPC